jgi:CHAT domain-containing protein
MVRRSRDIDEQETAYREVAVLLRESVWDPVQATGEGPVFLVPDGNLHLLNFDALVCEDGRFLVETGTTVRRLPTERFLGSSAPARDEVPGALLVGAPDYGSVVREISPSGMIFEPLPGARGEVARLGELWRESHPDLDPPLVMTGAGATEAAFREAAHGRTTLHLATHGYLLPPATDARRPNPLLRTGLAFAGANARGFDRVSGDDGILTAEELASLDLTHAEWAVLSACGTGLGEIGERGEGVFGLARALQIAGARTVIMSLWAVDDEATLNWMGELYEARLTRGLATDEAMRAASIQTIQARRAAGLSDHPFYWAAFVSSGSWE